jgi:ABC-type uncharacterized transport system substrate-binding protein
MLNIFHILKKLLLGFLLIIVAASFLLLSDLDRRRVPEKKHINKIAINQFASRPTLDETAKGIIDALNEKDFYNGKNIIIRNYNAENDLSTANAIAKEITDGRYDLVISISTPSLQTTANANTSGKTIHIFSTVTDPAGAGVGISRKEPLNHPPHLAGIGTFQPVAKVFRLIKQIKPDLITVGVVWNPSEACSFACLEIAREICKELNIELIEATVDNSTAVYEAALSLLPRGVQAIWIGGDNTVELASSSVIMAANRGRIPVFTNNTDHPEEGALLGLGANYYEVGKSAGNLVAQVLNGLDPALVPIEDITPPKLGLNITFLKDYKDNWRIPEDILKSADFIIQ